MKNGVKVKVIAGEANGILGPVTEIAIKPLYLDVQVPAKCEFEHTIPDGHRALIYVYRGKGIFAKGNDISAPKMLVLSNCDAVKIHTVSEPVKFLLMGGKPIGEPIVRYGPFLMNTEAEIRRTLADLQNGAFVKK